MRRLFCILLCFITFMSSFLTSSAAQEPSFSVYALPNAKVFVTIRKSGGSVVATACVTANPLLTVSTTLHLQRNSDESWETVSSNNGSLDVSTTTSADSGSSYQAYVICTIYDNTGNVVDTIFGYSTVLST